MKVARTVLNGESGSNADLHNCKQVGVSFRDYFCRLLRELKKGRTDYENLLPMTIYK